MPKTPYRKNDCLNVTIQDIGINGEGIGKTAEGYTLFVKNAVPGDTVRAQITKPGKTYAYARAAEILTPSEWRVEPVCPEARRCGGCQLQELSYEKQLEFKENKVREDLIRLGGFPEEEITGKMEPILGMEKDAVWHYRNKTQMPVQQDSGGHIIAGFYAGHSHRVIKAERCELSDEDSARIIRTLLGFFEEKGIRAYDESTGEGAVRHILIRRGAHTGQIMVCLIINSENLPYEELLVKKLRSLRLTAGEIKSIVLNVNKRRDNVILGEKIKVLCGTSCIEDTILDTMFRISALSFFQVNPVQTENLYRTAIEYAGLTGTEEVWDLYCGAGTISLCMAKKAGHVTGVEIVPDAVENARENARLNGINNADFFCGKAEDLVQTLTERPDTVVVDPPRKGLDPVTVGTIVKAAPSKIVYVSCNPSTLARDLAAFCRDGYEIAKIRPVDMFPMTVHVETVVLMSRKDT